MCENIIIVDNNSYSFIRNLKNGIPIIPFVNDVNDTELCDLKEYLISICNEEKIVDVVN